MIKLFIKKLIFKFKWKEFKEIHGDVNGNLVHTVENALKAYDFIKVNTPDTINPMQCRNIYVVPYIENVYELIIFLKDAIRSIEVGPLAFSKKDFVTGELLRLDLWLKQPEESIWIDFNILELTLLIGECIKILTDFNKESLVGTIPDSYLERRLSRSVECFLTLVEILGDHHGSKPG